MCGIAGSTTADPQILDRMVGRIGHRGPDASGQWFDERGAMALGHARLAIIDLSPGGAQPMQSPCGRWVIAFNGEIYNYRQLRAQLEAAGEIFLAQSDTEVLLRLLMRQGLKALDHLIGMFAFALWDRQEQSLLLVRDRLGVKPLVYSLLADGGIAFASEIHALRAHPGVDLGLDGQALSDYLACLYVPAPRTIHAGIKKLPPGHWLEWKAGQVRQGQWWHPRYDGQRCLTLDQAADEILPLLDDAVRLRMVADVEVGCFLSGGIDSSVIAALMARAAQEGGLSAPRTFTMTFDEAAYDERDAASDVARHLGTIHTQLPAKAEVERFLGQGVTRFGEPFGNPTAILINDLSAKARQHVTVALVGDGGDEVFAGYPRYDGGLLAERYRRAVPAPLRILAGWAAHLIPESSQGRHSLRRAREFLTQANKPLGPMYAAWVEYFDGDERAALLHLAQSPASPIAQACAQASGSHPLDIMQETDLKTFLPGNLLAYGDAMSMDVALELRLPFLDHRLVDAVGRLDPALRMMGGKKAILKQIARKLLPGHIVDRPKLGFNPPMGLWLKGALKSLVDDRLTPARCDQLGLHWPAVATLLAQHRSGRRDVALKVWSLLVLDAWERGLAQDEIILS